MVGDETMSVLEIWGAEYQEQVWSVSIFYHWMFSSFDENLKYTVAVLGVFLSQRCFLERLY